jgi:hypothetical protein
MVFLDPGSVTDDLGPVLESAAFDYPRGLPSRWELLPHFSPPTEPLSDWLEQFRDRVRPQLIRRLARELDTQRARADWRSLERVAKGLLELDPFNETATLCLAETLARIGSKSEAVALLRRFEREVGIASESLTLPTRILAKRISASPAAELGPIDTPMFGREEEMGRLADFWSRARAGHFTTVLVCGAESIGKSRLASEFASVVRIDGTGAVLVTRRAPLDTQRPLSLFSDIAKQLLALRGAAGCSQTTLGFISRLTQTRSTIHISEEEQRHSEYSHASVRRAVADLFDSVLSEQPLLLIVDNAEHLDDASVSLLTELRRCLSNSPCLLVAISRSSTLGDKAEAVRMRLGPLSADDAKCLSKAVSASLDTDWPDSLLEENVSLAAGNPGHLRLLLVNRARFRNDDRIPTDLIAAIDTQLSALSASALHMLQACALFGSPCSAEDIPHLTGLSGYALVSSLQELEDGALIDFRDAAMHCASSLIEQRAKASSTPGVTALLHLRAAQHLERGIPTSVASQAMSWTIAEHWSKAGAPKAALLWRQRCWQQLLAIGQPLAAVSGIRAALAAASSIEDRAALLSLLAVALRTLGDFPASAHALEERIALSEEVNDTFVTRRALAFDLLEARVVHSPDLAAVISSLHSYLSDAEMDVARRLRAGRLLMIAADHNFDEFAAQQAFNQLPELYTDEPSLELLRLHACLIFHTTFGDRRQAHDCLNRISQLAARHERSWIRVASATSTFVARRVIDPAPASTCLLEETFKECLDGGVLRAALVIAGMLTGTLFDDGRPEEASQWAAVAREVAAKLPVDDSLTEHPLGFIDLALHMGAIESAQHMLDDFLASAPKCPGPRLKREMMVYRCRVDQLCGRGTTDKDLDELLGFHALARRLGRHDDNVEVIWVALQERGESSKASELLEEYLRFSRRETRRCNYWLRTRTASDRAWSLPGVSHLT